MLPDDWKKEIVDSVDKADARNAERHEAQMATIYLTTEGRISSYSWLSVESSAISCTLPRCGRIEFVRKFWLVFSGFFLNLQLESRDHFLSYRVVAGRSLSAFDVHISLNTKAITFADFVASEIKSFRALVSGDNLAQP